MIKRLIPKIGLLMIGVLMFAADAYAAEYDIKEMTPEVRNAISARQARFTRLQELKSQGIVGENNKGYVYALKKMGDAEFVVKSENQDRGVIYQTIATQNNLGDAGLAVIETVFAEVQHERAKSGESIQTSTGQWVRK